jgi:short-subunit dehydrogenase
MLGNKLMKNVVNFMSWINPGVALITGASSGIGAEFARQLVSQNFDLILVARREEKLNELSRELEQNYHINTEILLADLSVITECEKVVSRIKELDNLDVLINNAGFGINNTFFQIPHQLHVDMINVHFTCPVLLSHAAIPGMQKRKRGVIIFTASTAAINKSVMSVMYTNTKTAVTVFAELLRNNVKEREIYIQALCPGFTYTEFHDTESMKGFQRDWFPKESWMEAKEVVSLSLKAIKNRETIFIPGEMNRNFSKDLRKKNLDDYLNCKTLFI